MKWEYDVREGYNWRDLLARMSEMGEDGWEIVAITELHAFLVAFFKRPIEKRADDTGACT